MRQQPHRSVVFTTNSQAPCLGPSVEAIFAQTRQSDEVIVVDDGSAAETPKRVPLPGLSGAVVCIDGLPHRRRGPRSPCGRPCALTRWCEPN